MKSITFFLLLLFSFSFAKADEPVIYSRDTIVIAPKKIVQLQKADEEKKEKPPEAAPRPEHNFNVEIRSGATRQSDGLFLTHPFTDSDGMLMIYSPPKLVVVSQATIYTPMDILFLREDGTIMQIAPDTDLSSLAEDIIYGEPIKGLLYLKAGICKKLDIQPGDWVKHGLFKRTPDIMTGTHQP